MAYMSESNEKDWINYTSFRERNAVLEFQFHYKRAQSVYNVYQSTGPRVFLLE